MPVAMADYDVAVVGLGPVGALFALLLPPSLRVLAVDREEMPFDKPRAIAMDSEAMRALQRVGLADILEPMLGYYPPSEFRDTEGNLLRRIRPAPPPYPLAWPSYGTFVQPELDGMLREELAKRANIDLRVSTELVALSQDDDAVTLSFKSGETAAAKYLIACDGGASTVRKLLSLPSEDLAFDEPWIVVDMLLKDGATVTLPPCNTHYCDPVRPYSFINGPRNLRRFEFSLHPHENLAEMATDGAVWGMLKPHLTPENSTIWRIAPYRFHAVVVEEWRAGRVFLAGDSAHQTPPFMGQGMNQGIRDSVNLAWKLAYVLQGRASPSFLDTYREERRPNVRSVIAITKELGKVICERDPAKCGERNARMRAEVDAGKGDIIRQDLLPPLASGYLFPSPGAGTPGPQPYVKGHRRLDGVLGHGYQLLLREALEGVPESKLEIGVGVLGELEEEGTVLRDWFDRYGCGAALVRPDGIVFGTSDAAGVGALIRAAEEGLWA
ncbi:putative FAD-binding monooxygenase [Hyaloraphidium curvatum]|nr:putative FAD-binding monooxygenase [Hyaloraphidium curvatum]